MSAFLEIAWITGFGLLLVWLVRTVAAARRRGNTVVGRAPVAIAALWVALLGMGSAYVWGIDFAQRAMDRILSARDGDDTALATPARARLFLRHVHVMLTPATASESDDPDTMIHEAVIGYSPDATLRLPRAYELAESTRGWNVLRLTASGPQSLSVARLDNLEDTGTRVMLFRERRGSEAPATPDRIERRALDLVGIGSGRCNPPDGAPESVSLDGPGSIYALLCIGSTPRAALVFERDLNAAADTASTAPVRLTPLVWAGSKWRPHHVQVTSGSLIQIGTLSDALPGVTLWEVPAPAARAELFFPPKNLHASCSEWLDSQQMGDRGYVSTPLGVDDIEPPQVGHDDDPICVLPFTPPFGLEVRRLLPDMPSIAARSLWAAGLLVTPALFLLFFLCAQTRSRVTAQRFARTLALSWFSIFLSAIGVWRLLWSHRIDMLRDYESVGQRVLQNQVLLTLAGATLAATAVLCWTPIRRPLHRMGLALGAWAAWLVLGGYALRGDLASIELGGRVVAQLGLSLAIGTAAGWLPLIERVMFGTGAKRLHAAADRLQLPPAIRAWVIAMAALGVLSVAALIARAAFPRAVALKLGLAWALVLLFYGALRACFSPDGMAPVRVLATFALAAFAAVTQAAFDPGVTAAVAFPGMVLAILFASHDARYGDESVRQIAAYRRHHAPLVIAHAALVGAVAIGIAIWAATGLASAGDTESDAVLAETLTFGAIHAVAVLALLFLPAAAVAFRRRGVRAAVPWLVASAILLTMWSARGPALDRTLGSDTQAANRIAIVVDPGYALLRSETKFLAGITAWRETIIPTPMDTPATSTQLINGQGYFGAQLIDPGVLLSVENDYFPVLLLREAGIRGLLLVAIVLLLLVAGLWLVSGDRFRHGTAPQRMRGLIAVVLGILCVYQPLASLGVLPLTGIAWPGLGLDSPSDFWLLVAMSLWILVWGERRRDEEKLDEFDADLRRSKLFRRVRIGIGASAALLTIAGLLLLTRASAFALRRPNPIDTEGHAVAPFTGLQHAIDYTRQLRCPREHGDSADPESIVPEDLLADPLQSGVRRFHSSLVDAWDKGRAAAVAEIGRFVGGDERACPEHGISIGRWRFERAQDDAHECRAVFKSGWPEVHISVRRQDDGAIESRCMADAGSEVLKRLRIPLRRPYENARIRLVSRAMGKAATDRGELISGHLTVRLRPGAGEVDVSDATAGLYLGETVSISPELSIEISGDAAVLRHRARDVAEDSEDDTLLFVRETPKAPVHVLEADEGRWRLLPPGTSEIPLDHMALIVVGGAHARSLWLFRPPTAWGNEAGSAVVDPLMADDVSTVRGERRRHYLYGSLMPELGWVNPFHSRSSLGLDGWVHVALSEYETTATWGTERFNKNHCGTLAPAASTSLDQVCARSPLDGVLECRISVQPELAIRMRHLTELLSLRPERFEKKTTKKTKKTDEDVTLRPSRGGFVLLRGDTGEIVAQGEFVPGRASSAYAPATPEIEQHLIRLREDRDPVTGRLLPREDRGEASAEKIEWAQPIAVGSTMKPLLGHALELADPGYARSLVLEGDKFRGARCAGGKVHAILGHCPPTDTLWERASNYRSVDMNVFVSHSLNWYQAAIGLLGTAVPRGTWGFGDQTSDGKPLLTKNVGDHSTSAALWTKHTGTTVLSPHTRLALAALRETPMWSRFESIIGRPLCTNGNKTLCRRNTARRDVCSARALPIDNPTRDLRHLVSLGPSSFDFYPELRDDTKTVGTVNTREYLQFLRGSGLHPLGSLAQLTDAFNRVVFQYDHDPATAGGYQLAATWFPVGATPGVAPPDCATESRDSTVRAGLCTTLTSGTATRDLGDILDDPDFVFYGAKTGTIDSLGEIAEDPTACEHFRTSHTVPDRRVDAGDQPYWIQCEDSGKRAQNKINDTLLVLSFGVRTADGIVPFTLGLRFQRGGIGFTTRAARHYLDVVRDYFK